MLSCTGDKYEVTIWHSVGMWNGGCLGRHDETKLPDQAGEENLQFGTGLWLSSLCIGTILSPFKQTNKPEMGARQKKESSCCCPKAVQDEDDMTIRTK